MSPEESICVLLLLCGQWQPLEVSPFPDCDSSSFISQAEDEWNTHKTTFHETLRRLAEILSRHSTPRTNPKQEDIHTITKMRLQQLRELENLYTDMISAIHDYTDSLTRQRLLVSSSIAALNRKQRNRDNNIIPIQYYHLISLSKTLAVQLNKQIHLEESILHSISRLMGTQSHLWYESTIAADSMQPIHQDSQHLKTWAKAIHQCTLVDRDLCDTILNIVLKKQPPPLFTPRKQNQPPIHIHNTQKNLENQEDWTTTDTKSNPKYTIDTIFDRIGNFLERQRKQRNASNSSILETIFIIGPEGSGKTFLCDAIQKYVSKFNTYLDIDQRGSKLLSTNTVDRPTNSTTESNSILPNTVTCIRPLRSDFIGYHAKSTMDRFLSLFTFVTQCSQEKVAVVLLLDDVDLLLLASTTSSSHTASPTKNHTSLVQVLLLEILDYLLEIQGTTDVMVIVTSRTFDATAILDIKCRFDHIVSLSSPANSPTRRQVLTYCLSLDLDQQSILKEADGDEQQMWHRLLQLTEGYTVANIIEFSEKLFQHFKPNHQILLQTLQNTQYLNDFIDGYGSRIQKQEISTLPFHGKNAHDAWQRLQEIIITPLCRAHELENLLFDPKNFPEKLLNSRPRHAMLSGVLVTGPVGSGKTTLATYCAAVAVSMIPSIRVLNISCTSLVHKELGESERAMKRLFETARSLSPCILILDGIETVAAKRGFDNTTEGTMDRLLSTLLVEIDGLARHEGKAMAVIGITKHPSWVDSALYRPGRLNDSVHLDHPDYFARISLLQSLLPLYKIELSNASHLKVLSSEDLVRSLATFTAQWSAAEVQALLLESARIALNETLAFGNVDVKNEQITISLKHIENALKSVKR